MVYLYHVLKDHFRKEFDWISALLVFLFAGTLVLLQYQFHLIRDQIVLFPHLQRIPFYWLLFSGVFAISCGILYWRKQIPNVFKLRSFWLMIVVAFFINALDQSYFLLSIVKGLPYPSEAIKAAVVSIATHSVAFFSVIIPVMCCSLYFHQQDPPLYGLVINRDMKIKPYWMVLFVALILVAISTASSGIGSYYPVYHRSGLYKHAGELGIPLWLCIGLFETVYASDFIAVELFFRGFWYSVLCGCWANRLYFLWRPAIWCFILANL
jgi:hypothetical protein